MNSDQRQSRTRTVIRVGMFACALLLLSGCDQAQLPTDAELRIAPSTRTFIVPDRRDANGSCFLDQSLYIDQPVVLSMVNSEGSPLGDVQVSVYVDWSGISYPGPSALALYDDRRGNNNGIADDFELVSGNGDTVVKVKTDYYGGDRPLLLRINLSCGYKGQLFAFSDGISAASDIEVTNEAEIEVEVGDEVDEQ